MDANNSNFTLQFFSPKNWKFLNNLLDIRSKKKHFTTSILKMIKKEEKTLFSLRFMVLSCYLSHPSLHVACIQQKIIIKMHGDVVEIFLIYDDVNLWYLYYVPALQQQQHYEKWISWVFAVVCTILHHFLIIVKFYVSGSCWSPLGHCYVRHNWDV